jgi:hypothetical protein
MTPDVGQRFVDAIATRNWSALQALFAPEACFRALVPSRHPFREHHGPEAAVRQIEKWFRDGDVHELLESEVAQVQDRVRVRYLIRNHEPAGWHLVEQQAYITVGPDGVTACDLICSGFRPTDPPQQD